MRKSLALSLILFAAACAPRPEAASTPAVVTPTAPPSQLGGLYGLSVQELASRFGKPALQIHEGAASSSSSAAPAASSTLTSTRHRATGSFA